jgi:hypothetical protein
MLPLFLLIIAIAARLLTDVATAVVSLVLSLAFGAVLYLTWVPLVPREITNPQLVAAALARREASGASQGH